MGNNKNIDSDIDLNKQITVISNVSDNLIRIMETKLENILLKHKQAVEVGADWKTPLGLFIAIVAFFGAGNFDKDFLSIDKSYWGSFFFIVLLLSVCWFISSIIIRHKNRKENIDSLIKRIKAEESKIAKGNH